MGMASPPESFRLLLLRISVNMEEQFSSVSVLFLQESFIPSNFKEINCFYIWKTTHMDFLHIKRNIQY